jgi:hypothetical protein
VTRSEDGWLGQIVEWLGQRDRWLGQRVFARSERWVAIVGQRDMGVLARDMGG